MMVLINVVNSRKTTRHKIRAQIKTEFPKCSNMPRAMLFGLTKVLLKKNDVYMPNCVPKIKRLLNATPCLFRGI